ncbi:MAG: hypothetical protein ABF476_06995, partial [Bifidobacterium aquikefiri]|uniref:hypothetical protein n=1 Tax=Bifidobacterium aquikefiri TaxID=1653207 RepID=UPI0039ED3E43
SAIEAANSPSSRASGASRGILAVDACKGEISRLAALARDDKGRGDGRGDEEGGFGRGDNGDGFARDDIRSG